MLHRLTPLAQADLDDIWYYLAVESSSFEVADRVIDAIAERFYLLTEHPYLGRPRDRDLGAGRRSLPADNYTIVYRIEAQAVLILRVVHSRRDLKALMRDIAH